MKKGAGSYEAKKKIRRKGIHAKRKTSTNKGSDNYKKPYKGQGNK